MIKILFRTEPKLLVKISSKIWLALNQGPQQNQTRDVG